MKILSRAPCRVDVAGGTIDIWPLYLYHDRPVTVNFAINCHASCELTTRDDGRITLSSQDLNREESFDSLDALKAARSPRLPLLTYLVRFFEPECGLDLRTNSESPAGAGIAGSSTLIITIVSALNQLTGRGYDIERLREIAQNIEAQIIRVPTGCQDYYPAMYGGVGAVELRIDGIFRKPIPVDLDDFNGRIALAYTGEPRDSGINNWEVVKAHVHQDRKVHRNFDRIADIARGMREALEKSDWTEAGRLLREEWTNRRKNAPGITTPLIDRLVQTARRAGATGAKACGAGGGGCVFFLCERGARPRVEQIIAREGATVLPVRVAPDGVKVTTQAGAGERSLTVAARKRDRY